MDVCRDKKNRWEVFRFLVSILDIGPKYHLLDKTRQFLKTIDYENDAYDTSNMGMEVKSTYMEVYYGREINKGRDE